MASDVESPATVGRRALEVGDWPSARDAFQAALDEQDSPDAALGLGEALWWLGDIDASIVHRERAYAGFRRQGQFSSAVLAALLIYFDYRSHLGNRAVATGWLRRAVRLADEHGLDDLQGWLRFAQACDYENLQRAEELAREALAFARATDDLDLELCAVSQVGTLLVQRGWVDEGVAWLDEAMAGSLGGEGGQLDTVVFTSCNMMLACTAAAQFERAVQWVLAADQFTARYGCPFLYAECRTSYGAVLAATGDWVRAEEQLLTAVRLSRTAVPAVHRLALSVLAELRLAQGRIADAEQLVAGLEDHPAAVVVWARIHLQRGHPETAAATLRRRLAAVNDDGLERGALLELLGEAELALGSAQTAAQHGRHLSELGSARGSALLLARGERLLGRAMAGRDDPAAARQHLETALATFLALDMPYEVGCTRLLLAATARHIDHDVAVHQARTALSTFERVGAGREADRAAALLRDLGMKAARAAPRTGHGLTKREREVLELISEGCSNPEIAQRLFVSRKTVEHHVASLLAKLGVRSRTEAAAVALRQKV